MSEYIDSSKQELFDSILQMNEEGFLDFVWHLEKMCVDYRLGDSGEIPEDEMKNLKKIEVLCTKILKENGHD